MGELSKALSDWYEASATRLDAIGLASSIESKKDCSSLSLDNDQYRSTVVAWDHESTVEVIALDARTGERARFIEDTNLSDSALVETMEQHVSWLTRVA